METAISRLSLREELSISWKLIKLRPVLKN